MDLFDDRSETRLTGQKPQAAAQAAQRLHRQRYDPGGRPRPRIERLGVAGRSADILNGAAPPAREDTVSTSSVYPILGGDGGGAGNQELRRRIFGVTGQAEVAE